MWDDFTDFELAQLAGSYGLQDYVVFNDKLSLSNRDELTTLLEEYEYNMAFPVDFNYDVEYTS